MAFSDSPPDNFDFTTPPAHGEREATREHSGSANGELTLVTGASGFLGRHLIKYLSQQGKTIRALYNNTPPDDALKGLAGVEWLQCDLLDIFQVEDALADVSYVYHCAAIVSFDASHRDRMIHFNVESTTNVVNEALVRGVKKLLFVSSVAALGRAENQKEITEEEQWEESKYNSRYGFSKQLAEMEVWRGFAEGLDGVVVNPGIILGEGNWNEGSARLMKVVYKEFPFYTSGINAWVDVADVIRAMVQLMDSNISGERFILSAGNYSYREIFTRMAEALGKKPPHIRAGGLLTSLVWRWSIFRSRLFGETATITRETARSSQRQAFYNAGKLPRFLPGFTYSSIDSTVRRMAAVFKSEMETVKE